MIQRVSEGEIHDSDQGGAGEEERPGIEQREPGPDSGSPPAFHEMRYPAPGMVWITGGSPSLRRSIMMVNRTTPVKGSMCSSQAFSRSCSAETTPPSARRSSASTANSLRDKGTCCPS